MLSNTTIKCNNFYGGHKCYCLKVKLTMQKNVVLLNEQQNMFLRMIYSCLPSTPLLTLKTQAGILDMGHSLDREGHHGREIAAHQGGSGKLGQGCVRHTKSPVSSKV